MSEERRLAAILAADMVGYSRLMEADESGTITRQKTHRSELIDPKITEHNGRIVKTTGDGILVEFGSIVDAVKCAVFIQRAMTEREADVSNKDRIQYRIGVNLGDIVIEEDDILGEGVNVAARLEGLADPGGICIPRKVFHEVRNKLDVGYEYIGEQRVKNINTPIPVYRILLEPDAAGTIKGERWPNKSRWKLGGIAAVMVGMITMGGLTWWQPWVERVEPASVEKMAHPLPEKPSIAVLPFTNMSGDKEQEYFADGISEDIITDLSKVSGLFVVARNSSFTYKGKVVKVRQVAEDLGVHYVLEGSVRRASNKLRITAQLIDAIKGNHLWAERYDREIKDVFAIQSEVTLQVVKAMEVTLKANEHDRLFQKYVTNIDAYDAFLRARRAVVSPSKANVDTAERLFKRTIELDPNFAGGYAGLSFNYSVKARFKYGVQPKEDARRSLELAQKAIQVDKIFAWSHIALAGAYLANGDHEGAVDAAQQAIQIQPNGYEENVFIGFYLTFAGQSARAVKHLEVARRMSPIDTVRGLAFSGFAYFMNGDYSKSEEVWRKRLNKFPVGNPNSYVFMAATQSMLGKTGDAAATVEKLLRFKPNFRLSQWWHVNNYQSPENRKRLYDAAKRAGIPE